MSSVVVAPARAGARAPRAVEHAAREVSRPRSALLSRVYLPACLIAAGAVILIGVGWATGWGGARFADSATSLRAVVAGPFTLAIVGVFLVVERVWPAQARPLVARGHRHDLLFMVVNGTFVVPLVTGLTLAFVQGTGFGLIGDLIIGVAGAFIGGWLLPQLGVHLGTGTISAIIDATIGALILLLVMRLIRDGNGWRARLGRSWNSWR